MKRLITVKTFFEYIFSDENTSGVSISEKAIEDMNNFTFESLEKLLLDCKILPYHCLYNWTDEDEKLGDFETKNLQLVRKVEHKVVNYV